MLRISRLTDYGTVVLAHLACDDAGPVSAAEVAAATGLALPTATSCFGILFAYLAPQQIQPLGLIPAAELAAILAYRPGERYRLIAIDGALAAGALGAIALIYH